MKKFTVSIAAALAMSTFAVAGGDMKDVEPAVEPVVEVVEPAEDHSGFYIGGAISLVQSESSASTNYGDGYYMSESMDITVEADQYAFMFQAGYQFNKYVAVEGRYWTSIGDAEITEKETYYYDGQVVNSYTDEYDVDSDFDAWGVYVKPMYPVTNEFTVYGLLGYADVDNADSGFSWGLGASYSFTDNLSVFADFVRLYDDSVEFYAFDMEGEMDLTLDTWNFGLTYKF